MMDGSKFRGRLYNEARGTGAGSTYFSVRHKTLREAIDAAINNHAY
jgi:hypothetical protein